jgi:hypothetical protein
MADPATQKLFVLAIFAMFMAGLVTVVGYLWWQASSTIPLPEGFAYSTSLINGLGKGSGMQGFKSQIEGFYAGPAVGAGVPNCMQSSKDCAALNELLTSKPLTAEEGADDLRELQLILSKISCFKRDLTGAAGVVEATRYQPFSTAHDLEPVAETTARCFAKTIPQRDLALGLDKWGGRGTFLIKRLCTAENLTEAEETEALQLFGDAMADINDIALGRCCNSDVGVIAGQPQPRMVGGFESTAIANLRQYTGYY